MSQKTDTQNVESFLAVLVTDAETCAARVRKAGPWCFFCGDDRSLMRCGCGMPETFGCADQRVCSACSVAHRAIGSHIKTMLQAKRTDRVSSIRARMYNQLFGAAEAVDEAAGTPLEQSLHCQIAQTDPYDDENREFRGTILGAFRLARFTDFQGLAKELEKETNADLQYRMARYFSSCAF